MPCSPPRSPPFAQCSGITPTSALVGRAKTDKQAGNRKSGLRRTICRFFYRVFLPKDLPEAPVCGRHRWRCLHSKTSVFRAHPPEHITGGNARGIPRAIGRGSPVISPSDPRRAASSMLSLDAFQTCARVCLGEISVILTSKLRSGDKR